MKVQIVGMSDRGIPNKERLHLRALLNFNLAYLIALNTRGSGTAVDPGSLAAFWFPAKEVKHGDSIVLYSNIGEHTQEPAVDGTTNHFYHWGFPQTIWQDPAACVVVLDILDWQSTYPLAPTPSLASSLGLGTLASLLGPRPLPPLPPLGSGLPPERR